MPIAVLAYGSLIEDPGKELKPLVSRQIPDVETPFSVEFARSSCSRDGAPTLVPVDVGGASVRGVLLVLDAGVDRAQAEDLLWRRETRQESSDSHYARPPKPGNNHVLVECVNGLAGVETVLYTKIGANVGKPTAELLAELAIDSARSAAGARRTDGINYLETAIRQGIETPLTADYRAAILGKTGAASLKEAYERIRSSVDS